MIANVIEASRGPVRALRALLATLLTVALAAAGHALGGGSVPAGAILVLVALVLPLAVLATRSRWTASRALAALTASQVMVHGLLSLMSPTAGGTAIAAHRGHTLADLTVLAHERMPMGASAAGAHVHGPGSASGAGHGSGAGLWSVVTDTFGTSPGMLLAHGLMIVLTGILLARGESLLWAVLARWLPSPVRARTPRPLTVRAITQGTWLVPVPVVVGPRSGRGPPAACTA